MFNLQLERRPQINPGWRVDNNSPITFSTAYRWITDAAQSQVRSWKEAETYTLFPVEVRPSKVLTYSVHKNGASLSQESQDIIVPGDYGVYTIGRNTVLSTTTGYVTLTHKKPLTFRPVLTFSNMEEVMKEDNPLMFVKVIRHLVECALLYLILTRRP